MLNMLLCLVAFSYLRAVLSNLGEFVYSLPNLLLYRAKD
jgi:hypothetical protein